MEMATSKRQIKEAADALDKAVDVLKKDGWGRKAFIASDGKLCLVGALNKSIFGGPTTSPRYSITRQRIYDLAYNTLDKVIQTDQREKNKPYGGVVSWNDSLAKDRREVISKLRKAAKLLRSE